MIVAEVAPALSCWVTFAKASANVWFDRPVLSGKSRTWLTSDLRQKTASQAARITDLQNHVPAARLRCMPALKMMEYGVFREGSMVALKAYPI